ncbi:MAG: hypothetical protein RI885_1733 [Actinomycetota bacterium]|jgi:pimeloyl-ACP methyl ester carboxylesterase
MTRTDPDDDYAPHPLQFDDSGFGLITSTTRSPLGTCIAYHRPERESDVATVFLHGAAGSWTTWTPLLAEAAARDIHLADPVLLDLPGWGETELADHGRGATIEAITELVVGTLDDLGYSGFHLVGHSLGGFVALAAAAAHPSRVLSVATVSGTTFSVIRSVEHPVRRFAELPGFTMLWRVMRVLALLPGEARPIARALAPTGLMRVIFSPLFRHGRRVPQSLVVATAADLRPSAFSAAAEVARGYDTALWGAITCPVAATKGDRDVFVTDRDLVELGRVIPHSRRTAIRDCGHFGPVERPAEVLSALGWMPA